MRLLLLIESSIYILFISLILFFIQPMHTVNLIYTQLYWHIPVFGDQRAVRQANTVKFPSYDKLNYEFNNFIFFYDASGTILHKVRLSPGSLATASRKNYAIYPKVGGGISLFNPYGEKLWRLDQFGYPILSPSGNRLLLISTDNTSIQIFDDNMNNVLPRKFIGTMLTDFVFSDQNDRLAIGSMDGNAHLLDYDGREILTVAGSTNSVFPYVKGVYLSQKGKVFATVKNLKPEVIEVYFPNTPERNWSIETETDRRHRPSLFIDSENDLLIDTTDQQIIFYQLKNGKKKKVIQYNNSEKSLDYAVFDQQGDKIAVLLNHQNKNQLLLMNSQGDLLWRKNFEDRYFVNMQLHEDGKSFMLQTSRNIYSYVIENI